jgi:hypothetical protein
MDRLTGLLLSFAVLFRSNRLVDVGSCGGFEPFDKFNFNDSDISDF